MYNIKIMINPDIRLFIVGIMSNIPLPLLPCLQLKYKRVTDR